MKLKDTKYSHLKLVELDPILEEMPDDADEFDLLGMWYTTDERIAIITGVEDNGFMTGVVTRNGRVYECTWDQDQRSIVPFRAIDDLSIKLG